MKKILKKKKGDDNEPLTRGEFRVHKKDFDDRFDSIDYRIEKFKDYVDARFDEIEEKMYTKEDHAKFMIWMDEAMRELRDTRESRIIYDSLIARHDDGLIDHEKRIRVLERR